MTKKETWEKLRKLERWIGKLPKGKWDIAGLGQRNEYGMRGYELKGADFSEAYLGSGNFSEAILSSANFSGAELYESEFIETNLSGANFSRARLDRADLSLANLSDADLSYAFLFNANLSTANLSNANLQGSILEEVNLNRANLSGADITGSTFWGASTAGWKIEGIKARYIYFCEDHKKDKENYRRVFQEGQFEELYRSLPAIDMIFVEGLSPIGLFTLSLLVERINKQNPNLGIKMADVHKNDFETRVGIKINKDEYFGIVGKLIQDDIAQATSEISPEMLTSHMAKILPNFFGESSNIPSRNPLSPIVVNMMQPTFQFIKADGSVFSGSISQSGVMLNLENFIIKNYESQRKEVDGLFADLKKSFNEYEVTMRNTLTETSNRMIEAIREGKDISYIQTVWEEIKEGVKTGGAAATIATTIARLLGLT